jgi:hypothetical protein
MSYNSVGYIDRKRVGRIAASALRDKNEIPRTIVRGSGFGSRSQSEAATTSESGDQAFIHDFLSIGHVQNTQQPPPDFEIR